jgi:hypothetical protein
MPFQSKAQQRAAFSGALGPEMKAKAETWAKETPNLKNLPEHVADKGNRRKLRVRRRHDLIPLR